MQVLIAVLDDLFRFAIKSIFGVIALPEGKRIVEALPPPLQPLLPLDHLGQKSKQPSEPYLDQPGHNFVNVHESQLRIDPVAAYDNIILTLPYGSQVSVHKYGGRWAYVQNGEVSGWLLKDELDSSISEVLPNFVVGSVYDADNVDTNKLRLLIEDEFSTVSAQLPLTSAEYVIYRLRRARRQIMWPPKRPRIPGQWQLLLRGNPGVHIGITPKTGSIMEYVIEDQGFLLYVEAVFPDQSIQLSGIDHDGFAVYSESVLDKDVWRELRPVFIEVL